MASAGLAVDEGVLKIGESLTSDFSGEELAVIETLGLRYDVLIEDVADWYVRRNEGKPVHVDDYRNTDSWEIPEDFEFGSMSGHCTFDEMITHLDNMVTKYPNLITAKESIGTSIEGKPLYMVKISDNPGVNETEPEVLYTALHHAREPVGLMQMLFYMYYLLENYDNDPFIQTLVDNTEMYFIPVVNPDGYTYNQQTNPNGGGMWRKNRRNNGGGSYGVDLNRNYGYMWGYNNSGSSPDPFDETYRGTAAFSEPEIQVIRDFCESHEFRLALNYHTYANLLLYAWGYIPTLCPDNDLFYAYAGLMTRDNHYTYGPACTTIYETNGSSDDWMYGEQTTKDKIFAYTPELGGDGDGFWCPINRIIPISQENMIQNLLLAMFAGKYAAVTDLTPMLAGDIETYFKYDIQRLGLVDGATYTVAVEPLENVASAGAPQTYSGLALMESKTDSILLYLDASIAAGQQFSFIVKVDNGDYVVSDTVTKVYGQTIVIFEDPCNNLTNWTGQWGLSTSQYHSPTGSITDSPNGNYSNNVNSSTSTTISVDLTEAAFAMLNFWARWDIEAGYDYVQVKASKNNGGTWTPLAGKYTILGNENQAQGEPLYDGTQNSWVQEEINLSDYLGYEVKFRFTIRSDSYVTEDGFYFDDFVVSAIDMNTSVKDNPAMAGYYISDPMPNPAHSLLRCAYNTPGTATGLDLVVFDIAGREVIKTGVASGQGTLSVSIDRLEAGLYYYRLLGKDFQSGIKKIIVR